MPKKRPLVERFWERVDTTQFGPAGCWMWASRNPRPHSYGRLSVSRGRDKWSVPAHRLSYWLNVGDLLPEQVVCHRCDTPGCVNPAHLFAGTHRDNVQDCIRKDRRNADARNGDNHWTRRQPEKRLYGTDNPMTKLTDEIVRAVRAEWAAGGSTQRAIARKYGLGFAQICRIISGKRWGHI